MREAVAKPYVPNRIQAIYGPAVPEGAAGLPLLEGKGLVDGKPALYLCRGFVCQAPITDAAQVESALTRATGTHRAATAI